MRQIEISLDGESLITPESIAAHMVAPGTRWKADELQNAKVELGLMLNIAMQQFERGAEPQQIIHRIAGSLHEARMRYEPSVWQQLIPIAQQHPVASYFLQDPFTRWSFTKPRGYSGDAQLLDFIYGHPSVADEIANAQAVVAAVKEAEARGDGAANLNGVMIDYTTSMQGSGFTFKTPNSTGGCGCGSSFSA